MVQVATLKFLMRGAAAVAACTKERSGIRAVEEAAKSAIGPVYDKFHLVPDELVRIADRNSDSSAAHRPTPPPSCTTVSGIAGSIYAKCEPVAKELYERYEAKAEQCTVAARRRLFPRMSNVSHWTEKCNEKVAAPAEKGCRVSALVATERISKMFSEKRSRIVNLLI